MPTTRGETLVQLRIRSERRRPLSPQICERNERVLRHLGLAYLATLRQLGRGQGEHDDLLQEAQLGLIQGAERFDPSLGARISSYVMPLATGAILHFRRDRERCLRIPWRLQALHAKGAKLQEQRRHRNQPPLNDKELALTLGVRPERWDLARMAHRQQHLMSLDQCQRCHASEGESLGTDNLVDQLIAVPANATKDTQLDWLREVLPQIPTPARHWLIKHHVQGEAVSAIARRHGVGSQRVRQEITAALNTLRSMAQARETGFCG
ncbi:MAG: sigma-70 family RNA polymerase sigma factor [Synechococcus sp.]|nr:sigma-70 family RNA polymerase sigma factor [Synechococcus sp.]